ncbi:MAG TPA: Ig-like domain-containing protein [Thermoleophilaceae bacterium]
MRRLARASTLLAVAFAAVATAPAEARRGADEQVDAVHGQRADDYSYSPSMSANGRFVAFSSWAGNLSPIEGEPRANVFVRDMRTGDVELVNRGADGGPASDNAADASISADGRMVAFASWAKNMTAANGYGLQVFVRDLATGRISLVSRRQGDGEGANRPAGVPVISPDGGFVAFTTNATNLSPEQTDETVSAVYVRDLATGKLTLASRADGPSGAVPNDPSNPVGLSSGGSRVAFSSTATNLDPADPDDVTDMYVRDLEADRTTLVSDDPRRAESVGTADAGDISDDGRYVVFHSGQVGLSDRNDDSIYNVYVRDMDTGTTTLVSDWKGEEPEFWRGWKYPSITGDGEVVTYLAADERAALRWDRLTGRTTLIAWGAVGYETSDDHRYTTYGTSTGIWRRDLLGGPPLCLDVIQRVLAAVPALVELPCSDEDGDPFSRVLDGLPGHGTLGAIDQLAGTVLYTPKAGFLGDDSFTYRAEGPSGAGPPATVTLAVGLPDLPLPPLPPIPPLPCADPLRGTPGAERLVGGPRGDDIRALAGNDRVAGLEGADCLSGGAGNDLLVGGGGADRVTGGHGVDRFDGGKGDDRIDAVDGVREKVACGKGADSARVDRTDRVSGCEKVRRVRKR